MGVLKIFPIFFLFVGCAKIGYLLDQANGQLHILKDAKPNSEILNDPHMPEEYKKKIRLIKKYKKFFYDYFSEKETSIYTKTYILKGEAVTHLLIASKYNEIKPKMFTFPFVGEFPYIGFFEFKSAQKWAKELENQDYVTYIRPVYAYSTLGYLEDRILSSFFRYSDEGLAELVFHELFHTIFFVKDEVSLNENLANLFGKEMAAIYFNLNADDKKERELNHLKSQKLRQEIVVLVKKLKEKYSSSILNKKQAQSLLQEFLSKEFNPTLKKTCHNLKVKNCWPLTEGWNNARFAAFLTYEKKQEFLHKLQGSLDLKQFYQFIKNSYKSYNIDDKGKKDFTEYLKSLK